MIKFFKKPSFICCIFIFCLGFLILSSGLNHPFIFDDLGKIENNSDLKSFDFIWDKLFYRYDQLEKNRVLIERNDPSRPFVYLIYTIIYQLGEGSSFYFHLFNAIIHSLNGVIIFFLTKRIFYLLYKKDIWKKPLCLSLFFILSPIQTGTAIYAYGLSDLLSTFFILNSLYFFIKKNEISRSHILFSGLFFILALLSKQSSLITPAIILLFDFIFIAQINFKKQMNKIKKYIFLFVISFIYLLSRWIYFGSIGDLEALSTYNRWDYLFVQPLVIFRYLVLTIFPFQLSIDHDFFPDRYHWVEKILCVTLMLSILIYFFRKFLKKLNSSEKIILFGIFFYFISLCPTSSFLPTADIMVERRVYFGNYGIFIILVQIYELIVEKLKKLIPLLTTKKLTRKIKFQKNFFKLIFPIIILFNFLCLFYVSFLRNEKFSDPKEIWQEVLIQYPNSPRANHSLALLYKKEKKFEDAKIIYEKIILQDPMNIYGYSNLASLYSEDEYSGRDYNKAIDLYNQAIAINPIVFQIQNWSNLGMVYQKLGRFEEAKKAYEKVLESQPHSSFVHNNLGLLYMNQGKLELAYREFMQALQANPHSIPTQKNLEILQKMIR